MSQSPPLGYYQVSLVDPKVQGKERCGQATIYIPLYASLSGLEISWKS